MTDASNASPMTNFNQQIIEDFRAHEGKVGGRFEGATLLLLHTAGAKSGAERINPVAYRKVGEDFAIFASKAGAPTNPDWYHNLVAHPDATVEVGAETFEVTARVAEGDERNAIWEAQKAESPNFAEYEEKTTRTIPVVVLQRRS